MSSSRASTTAWQFLFKCCSYFCTGFSPHCQRDSSTMRHFDAFVWKSVIPSLEALPFCPTSTRWFSTSLILVVHQLQDAFMAYVKWVPLLVDGEVHIHHDCKDTVSRLNQEPFFYTAHFLVEQQCCYESATNHPAKRKTRETITQVLLHHPTTHQLL